MKPVKPLSIILSLIFGIICITMQSCSVQHKEKKEADLILYHAYVYPVQGAPIEDGAVVIQNGKIIEVGNSDEITNRLKNSGAEMADCKGAFLMPGFIEGHGHFNGL